VKMDTSDLTSRGYGAVLWEPDQQTVHDARITRFMRWLADRGHDFGGYADLWQWSVTEPGSFWAAVWDYFEVLGHRGPGPVLTGEVMPDVQWFTGSTLNYARNALRTAWTDPDRTAIIFSSERTRAGRLSYAQLAHQVARVARGLRALGVRRGDRVVALLPNVPEAVIGLLAAASIGAIWSSCSPDFGARSVIDRFAQIEPTVLIAGDGYWYGGKEFSRATMVDDVVTALPGLSAVVLVDLIGQGDHVVDDGRVVPDDREHILWLFQRPLQHPDTRRTDVVGDGGDVVLDVRGQAADIGRRLDRLDPRLGPVEEGLHCVQPARLGRGQQAERLVTLVLQVVDQDGELLAEVRELRHPGVLGGAALRIRHPQPAEDHAHQQRRHDNGEQSARHRPVG